MLRWTSKARLLNRYGWCTLLVSFLYVGCGDGDPQPPADRGPSERSRSAEPATSPELVPRSGPAILFLGTSLTAGFGVDPAQAFPARIQEKIDSAGLSYRVVNGGVSGETSAGARRRIDWVLDQPGLRFVVVETGANDGLRGQDIDSLRANLSAILERILKELPPNHILVVGMEALPNLGAEYTSQFRQVYPSVASAYSVHFLPFLLAGVAGVDSLNQADGIHPSPVGHALVAAHLWPAIRTMIATEESR